MNTHKLASGLRSAYRHLKSTTRGSTERQVAESALIYWMREAGWQDGNDMFGFDGADSYADALSFVRFCQAELRFLAAHPVVYRVADCDGRCDTVEARNNANWFLTRRSANRAARKLAGDLGFSGLTVVAVTLDLDRDDIAAVMDIAV